MAAPTKFMEFIKAVKRWTTENRSYRRSCSDP